jgi:hypothetical protein
LHLQPLQHHVPLPQPLLRQQHQRLLIMLLREGYVIPLPSASMALPAATEYAAATINAVGPPGPPEHALPMARKNPPPTMTLCAGEAHGRSDHLEKGVTITILVDAIPPIPLVRAMYVD